MKIYAIVKLNALISNIRLFFRSDHKQNYHKIGCVFFCKQILKSIRPNWQNMYKIWSFHLGWCLLRQYHRNHNPSLPIRDFLSDLCTGIATPHPDLPLYINNNNNNNRPLAGSQPIHDSRLDRYTGTETSITQEWDPTSTLLLHLPSEVQQR